MPQKQTETKPMAKDAQARIAGLEAKLRKAELARDAYDEMINVAEAKKKGSDIVKKGVKGVFDILK